MNNKLLLVNPGSKWRVTFDFPSIGLASLVAFLRSKKCDLDILAYDFASEIFERDDLENKLSELKPDILGLSLNSLNIYNGKSIARLTRRLCPETLIVAGGVHASMRPEECLEFSDFVVRGEGEETFWEIVQGNEIELIKGLSYRNNGKVIHNKERDFIKDLDSLPFPEYDLFSGINNHANQCWGIMGSRGCPYDCIFCLSPKTWKRRVRFRSPDNIAQEIEQLHRKYKVNAITFHDDTINIPPQRAIDICNAIIGRNLHKVISFECQLKANSNLINPEMFASLREANFKRIYFGIESGSDRVLSSVHKSLTVGEAKTAIKMARTAGIERVVGFYMVGQWNESASDVFKTLRFIVNSKTEAFCGVCTPFPGTEFYNLLKQGGRMPKEPKWGEFDHNIPQNNTNKLSRSVIILFLGLMKLVVLIQNRFVRH
jgi:anaerobic magnesium-protoporphyrin IX monomethyl ester cyclase